MVLRVIDANMYSFANRLDDVALLYRRGQRLAPLVEAFRAKRHAMLVTPAAWAGLDLPHLVDNVVIPHLAILRPNALRQAVLEEALIRRGQAAEAAWGHLAAEGRGNALRRPSLAMGREIRAADDACGIRIADSAFRCVRTCCWNSAVA